MYALVLHGCVPMQCKHYAMQCTRHAVRHALVLLPTALASTPRTQHVEHAVRSAVSSSSTYAVPLLLRNALATTLRTRHVQHAVRNAVSSMQYVCTTTTSYYTT